MRLDVFQAKQHAEENIKKSGVTLTAEEQRLVEKSILDGTRSGLALPEKEREELTALQKEVSQASLEFSVRSSNLFLPLFPSHMLSHIEKLQRREGRHHFHC